MTSNEQAMTNHLSEDIEKAAKEYCKLYKPRLNEATGEYDLDIPDIKEAFKAGAKYIIGEKK